MSNSLTVIVKPVKPNCLHLNLARIWHVVKEVKFLLVNKFNVTFHMLLKLAPWESELFV